MCDTHMLIWRYTTVKGVPTAPDTLQMARWTVARLLLIDEVTEVVAALMQRLGTKIALSMTSTVTYAEQFTSADKPSSGRHRNLATPAFIQSCCTACVMKVSMQLLLCRKAAEQHDSVFKADKVHNLIVRLRHNVIRAGLRRISLAYSRISLADVAQKLGLANVEDTECIVAKAIRCAAVLAKAVMCRVDCVQQ